MEMYLIKNKVKVVRDWIGADHVLRDPNYFLFCETVTDVEFEMIEDEVIKEIK